MRDSDPVPYFSPTQWPPIGSQIGYSCSNHVGRVRVRNPMERVLCQSRNHTLDLDSGSRLMPDPLTLFFYHTSYLIRFIEKKGIPFTVIMLPVATWPVIINNCKTMALGWNCNTWLAVPRQCEPATSPFNLEILEKSKAIENEFIRRNLQLHCYQLKQRTTHLLDWSL